MRLSRVRIEGFRSIKRPLELHIDPRTTVLLGPNDHGKTNVLLALTHLQPDKPFVEEDRNWDLPENAHPKVTYHLDLPDVDRKRVITVWTAANPSATEKPKFTDIPSSLTLVRHGVGVDLGFATPKPSDVVLPQILQLLPRVELFEPAPSIPDSATAAEIVEPSHEFMQGIFLYAGIPRAQWPEIFSQTDESQKRLETASRQLNKTLRRDWSQGRDLEFELRHDSAAQRIALHLKDPAVKSRWVRASQRSSGFTHYFALRTRMYARTGGKRQGLYLWLFDEPGVWLHPAGQFDLMQALEALAASNQVMYSTHSIFMINRNFPTRHRLIVKSARGTELDAKPFVSRWSAALDALGFSISGTLLFAPCVLLAEGDADPVLIYATLQKLAEAELWDRDINSLSVMATGDLRNAEAIARLLLQGAHKPRIAVLVDGDKGGVDRARGLRDLVDTKAVQLIVLPKDRDTEDYIPDKPAYLEAVANAAADVSEPRVEDILNVLTSRYEEARPRISAGFGKWAGEAAKDIAGLDQTPSKVVIARLWAATIAQLPATSLDLTAAKQLADMIETALSMPARATEGSLFPRTQDSTSS